MRPRPRPPRPPRPRPRHGLPPTAFTDPSPEGQALIASLKRNGWTGPLNWYRNFDRNWELPAPYDGRTVDQPALFIGGEGDPVLRFMPPSLMDGHVTDLRGADILPGVSHFIQEEAPDQVNRRLLDFLAGLSE